MARKPRKSFFKREIEKLQELTFPQKLLYIWDYYKFYILAIIAGIAIIVSFIVSLVKGQDAYDVTCLVPEEVYAESVEYLQDTALELYPERNDVNRIQPLYSDHESRGGGDAYAKISMMIFSGHLDVVILDESTYAYMKDNDILFDLTEYVPNIDDYSESFVYSSTNTVAEEKLYALDFSNSEYADEVGYPEGEPVYLAIAACSKNEDEAVKLFTYLADSIK